MMNKNVYSRIIFYMSPYKYWMILAMILTFFGVLSMSLAPYFMGMAINVFGDIIKNGISDELSSNFMFYVILTAIVYIMYSILIFIASNIIIATVHKTMYNLRKKIDIKLSKLPLEFYDKTTYGDILSRLTNDVNTIANSLESCIFVISNAVFTVIIVFIIMLKISSFLTFIGLLTIPFLIFIGGKITIKSEKEYEKQMKKTGELNGIVEEYYSGHNIVTAYSKEEEVIKKFELVNNALFKAANKGDYLAGILFPITLTLNNLSYVLTCVIGAIIAISGGLSIGMIQAFSQYLNQFSSPISEVMQIVPLIQTTGAAAERVFEFIDEKEEIADVENPKFPEKLLGQVSFDHVEFGYKPHQILIHDLNINIKAGTKTAIVGPTGAGKTTLVNLIMRFYDVRKGAIKIDNVDIRDMKRKDLRNIFGMVLQDTWLYCGTIMENIRYGKLDATDEEVINAAKMARADAFIRTLPNGYNFILEEGASNIAAGERQLLTIARAMLSNSPILILDEATSSVDTRTEVLIQEAMENVMKGRTSFVIAHRLSTIKDSNTILYMQDGDILETGSHGELMAKNGLYAKLYNSQFEE